MRIDLDRATNASTRQELARQVSVLRQAAKMTQNELAQRAGVSRQTVSNLERGTVPQSQTLRTILGVLQASPSTDAFEDDTRVWLTMIGMLIESVPRTERGRAVERAVRALASIHPAENVSGEIRPDSAER